MIATSLDTVQSEPHYRTEYVKFELSQHTGINKLEDFHIVGAKFYYLRINIIINFVLLDFKGLTKWS
jgi:hypothetical protein